jgi:hypothetical protein
MRLSKRWRSAPYYVRPDGARMIEVAPFVAVSRRYLFLLMRR